MHDFLIYMYVELHKHFEYMAWYTFAAKHTYKLLLCRQIMKANIYFKYKKIINKKQKNNSKTSVLLLPAILPLLCSNSRQERTEQLNTNYISERIEQPLTRPVRHGKQEEHQQ